MLGDLAHRPLRSSKIETTPLPAIATPDRTASRRVKNVFCADVVSFA
jgi:hypothetical protein